MAASVVVGRSSKGPVKNSSATTASAAASRAESCVRAPAEALTAVFERLPATTIPLQRPEATFAPPSATSSRLASIRSGRRPRTPWPRPAPRRTRSASRRGRRRPARRRRRARCRAAPSDGSPLAIEPTVGTSRPKALTAAIAAHDRHQRTRNAGSDRRSPRINASESVPTSSVSPCVSPRCVTKCQACSKKSPLPWLIPNSLGSWPTMIVSARPMMKPFSTGWLMKSPGSRGAAAPPRAPPRRP